MRWTLLLLTTLLLSTLGCGGTPAQPPKGAEDSATSLDVQLDEGSAAPGDSTPGADSHSQEK